HLLDFVGVQGTPAGLSAHVERPGAAAWTAAEPGERRWSARLSGLLVGLPVGAELVVLPARLGRTEHFVRFAHFLEARLGGRVAGVDVRVVLPGELPEGLLDLL